MLKLHKVCSENGAPDCHVGTALARKIECGFLSLSMCSLCFIVHNSQRCVASQHQQTEICGCRRFGICIRRFCIRIHRNQSTSVRVCTFLWMGWKATWRILQLSSTSLKALLVEWKTNKKADSSDITNVLHYMLQWICLSIIFVSPNTVVVWLSYVTA